MEKNCFVLMGNFGSGKSELALNLAFSYAPKQPTTLIDLDIVNPYFRSSERLAALKEAGVRVLFPSFAMSNVEMLTLPPDILSAFVRQDDAVIFDIGGDATGAVALGQYKAYFDRIPPEQLHVYCVINGCRPLSDTPEKVLDLMQLLERTSRLSFTGLINNTNLSQETTAQELVDGYHLVRAVAEATGLPVICTCGVPDVLTDFSRIAAQQQLDEAYIGRLYAMERRMHRDWDNFTKYGL